MLKCYKLSTNINIEKEVKNCFLKLCKNQFVIVLEIRLPMDHKFTDEKTERLIKIGAIFDAIGINTVELAESIKDHIENCPGGKQCIEKLIKENT